MTDAPSCFWCSYTCYPVFSFVKCEVESFLRCLALCEARAKYWFKEYIEGTFLRGMSTTKHLRSPNGTRHRNAPPPSQRRDTRRNPMSSPPPPESSGIRQMNVEMNNKENQSKFVSHILFIHFPSTAACKSKNQSLCPLSSPNSLPLFP